MWQPSAERVARSNLHRYMDWLSLQRGLRFESYHDLWRWSVTDLEGFWGSLWEFFELRSRTPYTRVLKGAEMPFAGWFEGARLNYAEHALECREERPALLGYSETRPPVTLSYPELAAQVAAAAQGLRHLGVGKGDRVVAFLPNIPETVIGFLAAASIGAIWSSCPPEFGIRSVVERFQQIEPSVLLAVDGYRYRGRPFDTMEALNRLRAGLPSLTATVLLPYLEPSRRPEAGELLWEDFLSPGSELAFEHVPFEHPLWVLYSSGTTGPPKAIVHSQGGILLEHRKKLSLHCDVGPGDRFFWYTTTGWMMWNVVIASLLVKATAVLYDGHPGYPDLGALWRLAADSGITYFGTSAAFIHSCMKENYDPSAHFDLSGLQGLGSTGSPLSPEGFDWVYTKVNPDVLLNSVSGGTDMCTGLVGACPLLPVYSGEIPGPMLGVAVDSFDPQGRSVIDEVGELVVTKPMPSMPVCFWNDPDGSRYRETYFEMYPGVWRHGDWIRITPEGTCIIYGRSDSTLNRGGVRIGTSEFYRVVETFPEVQDSLVIDTSVLGREGRLYLFLVLKGLLELDADLRKRIEQAIRSEISPRYVPDEIHPLREVPYTLNGKKMEVPVRRILLGTPAEKAASRDAMRNPDSLRFFTHLAG